MLARSEPGRATLRQAQVLNRRAAARPAFGRLRVDDIGSSTFSRSEGRVLRTRRRKQNDWLITETDTSDGPSDHQLLVMSAAGPVASQIVTNRGQILLRMLSDPNPFVATVVRAVSTSRIKTGGVTSMPAPVVIVHDHPTFLKEATSALRAYGHDVVAFSDPF